MSRVSSLLVIFYAVATCALITAPCEAVLIADLDADYQPATSFGQTSDSVGISGTLAGSWHYFQDTDANPANGHNGLLTWQQDSQYENSETGYAGTSNNFGFPFPIISSDRLLDGPNPPPPVGSLMGHPSSSQHLAVEYRAHPFGQVDNLSIDYRFERPNAGGGFQMVTVSIVREDGTPLLAPTNVGVGGVGIAQGTLSGLGTLSPGESIWLMLGPGAGNFADGDQTWLQMALNGTPVAIPEASALGMVALTIGALAWFGRRK